MKTAYKNTFKLIINFTLVIINKGKCTGLDCKISAILIHHDAEDNLRTMNFSYY